MARALAALGAPPGPIPRGVRGAPVAPPRFRCSISHAPSLAAGLAAPDEGWEIGVDLEPWQPVSPLLASVLLSSRERAAHDALVGEEAAGDLLLRLAIKEALYKALDPWLGRFVAPAEVSLQLSTGGSGLAELEPARGERAFELEYAWQWLAGHVLATARARPRD
ncbi:MAG: hypothetical protein RL653_1213 [Pseudomonadota bacterium]